MTNNLLHIILAYQFTKNMKYLGPKGAIYVRHKKSRKTIAQHHILAIEKMFPKKKINKNIVVGFEADKLLKTFKEPINYSYILDYKNVNHGKIFKDLFVKYNPTKYSGCFISADISILPKLENINIDTKKNYVFYTENNSIETEITCNIQDNKLQYMLYNTSNKFWTGMAYLSNDAIRLIKHINLVYNTDQLFLLEIINNTISKGLEYETYQLKKKDFSYVKNNSIKIKTKVN